MMQREFGYHLEVMQTDAVQGVLRSPKYHQALYDPASFHFHPLNYARSLARAIEALGGKIFESSRVTGCNVEGAEKVVRTARGEVRARDVILAGGGYTDDLIPCLRRSLLPIDWK